MTGLFKTTEIERISNDGMALRNISDADPLCHNDVECRHQNVILFKVVNDATPWFIVVKNFRSCSKLLTLNLVIFIRSFELAKVASWCRSTIFNLFSFCTWTLQSQGNLLTWLERKWKFATVKVFYGGLINY